MFEFFQDYRKGRERLLMLLVVIVSLLALTVLGLLLYRQDRNLRQQPEILTRDKVAEEEPAETPVSALDLGRQAILDEDYAKAREILLGPEIRREDRAQAYLLLGMLEVEKGDPAIAADYFEQSELAEPSPQAYFGRARALIKLGRFQEAQTVLEFARQLSPSDITVTNALYLLQIQNGALEKVRETIGLKANLGLSHTAATWLVAGAALELEAGNPAGAAELLGASQKLLSKEDFAFLIGLEPVRKYADHPMILPFFAPVPMPQIFQPPPPAPGGPSPAPEKPAMRGVE